MICLHTGAAAAANMPQPNLVPLPADLIKRLASYDLTAPVSLQQPVLCNAANFAVSAQLLSRINALVHNDADWSQV
jgi:hypothetical protein